MNDFNNMYGNNSAGAGSGFSSGSSSPNFSNSGIGSGDLGTGIRKVVKAFGDAGEWISSGVKDVLGNIKDWCNRIVGDVGAEIHTLQYGDVVGIDAKKIPEMITAIETYVKTVEKHLDEIKTNTDPKKSMKGEYAEAVKIYVQTACQTCYEITSQLRFFEDKLILVQKAYEAKSKSMAEDITKTASDMDKQYDTYQRTQQYSGYTTPDGAHATPDQSTQGNP